MSSKAADKSGFSVKNVAYVAIPGILIVLAVFAWFYNQAQQSIPGHVDFLASVKVALHTPTKLAEGLTDKDDDLVADPPADEQKLLDPDTLEFEVLGQDLPREQEQWADFLIHLELITGKKVHLTLRPETTSLSTKEAVPPALQLARDMSAGKVHLASLNTGAVTVTVNEGGAVPFCVMADADGKFGYSMEIIVPAKSTVKEVPQLKGAKRVVFASLYSHSGFKSPLMTLWKEFDLQPERDYTPVFTNGQEQAMKEVAAGKGDAAPVASDLLQRTIGSGAVTADAIRSIYKSKAFPPACFAYAHQLRPELAEKIKKAFLEFDWKDTSLEKAYAAANQSKFVPATYKTDWAPVREVEAQVATLLAKPAPAASP